MATPKQNWDPYLIMMAKFNKLKPAEKEKSIFNQDLYLQDKTFDNNQWFCIYGFDGNCWANSDEKKQEPKTLSKTEIKKIIDKINTADKTEANKIEVKCHEIKVTMPQVNGGTGSGLTGYWDNDGKNIGVQAYPVSPGPPDREIPKSPEWNKTPGKIKTSEWNKTPKWNKMPE